MHVPPEREVCDFCGDPRPLAVFVCRPSRTRIAHYPGHPGAFYNDDGEWDACASCAPLVRGGDRAALEQQAVQRLVQLGVPLDANERAFVTEMQTVFWTNFLRERERGAPAGSPA